MNWIYTFLSMILGPISNLTDNKIDPFNNLKEFLIENTIRVSIMLLFIFIVGTIFSSGIIISVINLTTQLEQGDPLRFTSALAGGLGMILICSTVIAIVTFYFSKKITKKSYTTNFTKENKTNELSNAPLLEDAIALLITEFIKDKQAYKEKQFRRDKEIDEQQMEFQKQYYRSGESFRDH